MQNNNSKIGVIVAVIAAVLIGVGVWAWAMNNDNGDTQETTDSAQTTDTDMNTEAQMNIVETAAATPSLSTLVTAVEAADLVETLEGEGPFTVFAPTNDAFDKLPEGTLDDLLLPENKDRLSSVLTYHVVESDVMSTDLTNGQTITTVQGGTLTVEITDGMVYIVDANGDKAMVTTADVDTSNGVVHIIDSVLLPS